MVGTSGSWKLVAERQISAHRSGDRSGKDTGRSQGKLISNQSSILAHLAASSSNDQQYEPEQLLGPTQNTHHATIRGRAGVLPEHTAGSFGSGRSDWGHGNGLSRLEGETVGTIHEEVVATQTCHLGVWSCSTMAEQCHIVHQHCEYLCIGRSQPLTTTAISPIPTSLRLQLVCSVLIRSSSIRVHRHPTTID
jgi:hypothetical protein